MARTKKQPPLTPEETRLLLRFQDTPIEHLPPATLSVDGENPNEMSAAKFQALKDHIGEFGIINPILTNQDSLIADGEHRRKAAIELRLPTVPVKRLAITEAERRILRQTMNKLRGQHDPERDGREMTWLLEHDAIGDLAKFVGQDQGDLLRCLDTRDDYTGEHEEQFDPVAAYHDIETPVTAPGDIWRLGPHYLVCGDATDPTAWKALLQAAHLRHVEAMITDPPYNVNYGPRPAALAEAEDPDQVLGRSILGDNQGAGFPGFLSAFFMQAMEHVRGAQYVFMSCQEWPTLDAAFRAAGGHWSSTIVWVKDSFVLSRKDWHPQHEPIYKGRKGKKKAKETEVETTKGEPILYGWKEGNPHQKNEVRTQGDVWIEERPKKSPLHPMMKPLAILRKAILGSTKPIQAVIDPFNGSGSTLIACEQTRRTYLGIELDPRFVDVTVQRWEHYTGRAAEKVVHGSGAPAGGETGDEAEA